VSNSKTSIIYTFVAFLFLSFTAKAGDSSYIPQHDTIAEGETIISNSFFAKVSGGFMGPRMISIYYKNNDVLQLIGLNTYPKYGSRQNAYAISDDGKTLLYFHKNRLDSDNINKSDGLYEYTVGNGDIAIYDKVNSGVYIKDKTPNNSIVFGRLLKDNNTGQINRKIFIRDTKGSEYEWNPRKNK